MDLSAYCHARRWYLAYSGGLDSSVLLHLLSLYPQRPALTAVYIHHGLQAQADDWQVFCQQQASQRQVAFISRRVHIHQQGNIEEQARQARYQALAEIVDADSVVFTAHHQDDQVETFFYRLMRGAGLRGLQAMSNQRPLAQAQLVRPLLGYSRQQLADYAEQHQLAFVDDPSNHNSRYQRNFLRHQIIPPLKNQWPALTQQVSKTLAHLSEAQTVLDEVAEQDLSLLRHENDGRRVKLELLAKLSLPRQKNVLRYWLANFSLYASAKQLEVLLYQVIQASQDKNPELYLGDYCLRRFKQQLYLCPAKPDQWAEQLWQTQQTLDLAEFGRYRLDKAVALSLQVKKRQGGEVIELNGQHKTLKNFFQEQGIAPWLRWDLPLFYYQQQLIAVADYYLSEQGRALLSGAKIIAD